MLKFDLLNTIPRLEDDFGTRNAKPELGQDPGIRAVPALRHISDITPLSENGVYVQNKRCDVFGTSSPNPSPKTLKFDTRHRARSGYTRGAGRSRSTRSQIRASSASSSRTTPAVPSRSPPELCLNLFGFNCLFSPKFSRKLDS